MHDRMEPRDTAARKVLDPGIQLVPSDMGNKPIPGMHGFSPDDRDSTACILSVDELPEHPREIADFFRLMKQGAFELKNAGATFIAGTPMEISKYI